MHVEENPQGPDELRLRFLALRDAPTGFVLPSGARIRAAGTTRRRRRALVSVTGAALAAGVVAFLATNPSDRRQSAPPPATQVPTTATSTSATSKSAELLELGGSPNLIAPRDRVDPLLFVAPEVWAGTGLGDGHEVAWQAPSDAFPHGLQQVYSCDQDAWSTGKVGQVDFATDSEPLGRMKVRDLGSAAKARAFYGDAVETLASCQEAAAVESETSGPEMTVRRFDSLGIDTGERAMKVYEFIKPLDEPLIDYVAVGYTANGRFMAVRVNGSALPGAAPHPEVVAQIGEAALDRLSSLP